MFRELTNEDRRRKVATFNRGLTRLAAGEVGEPHKLIDKYTKVMAKLLKAASR